MGSLLAVESQIRTGEFSPAVAKRAECLHQAAATTGVPWENLGPINFACETDHESTLPSDSTSCNSSGLSPAWIIRTGSVIGSTVAGDVRAAVAQRYAAPSFPVESISVPS